MFRVTLYAVTTIAFCAAVLEGGFLINRFQQCEEGWKYYTDRFGSASCFKVVRTPLPWQQAQEYCGKSIAHLVNLDPISQFTSFDPNTEAVDRLTDYVFKETSGEFWSGMNVKSGRLMWDSYGPEFVKQNYDSSWSWANGQPMLDGTLACGHVIQGKRTIQPTTTTTPDGSGSGMTPNPNVETTFSPKTSTDAPTVVEIFDGNNTVKLTSCEKELPFVCQKPVLRTEVKFTSFCPDGWLGNQYLPYCFQIMKDPMPLQQAMDYCRQTKGGEMYQALPLTMNFTMATQLLQFYVTNDKYFEVIPTPNVWIDGGPVTNDGGEVTSQCYALQQSVGDEQGFPIALDCVKPLPFVCIRPTEVQEKANKAEVASLFFNQDVVSRYRPFTMLPISVNFTRPPSDNEIIFIHTPTRSFNSSMNFFQETIFFSRRLSFRYNVTQSDRTVSPYEVNISLPSYNQGLAARKKRSLNRLPTMGHIEEFHLPKSKYRINYNLRNGRGSNHGKGTLDDVKRMHRVVKELENNDDNGLMIQLLSKFMSSKHDNKQLNHFNKVERNHRRRNQKNAVLRNQQLFKHKETHKHEKHGGLHERVHAIQQRKTHDDLQTLINDSLYTNNIHDISHNHKTAHDFQHQKKDGIQPGKKRTKQHKQSNNVLPGKKRSKLHKKKDNLQLAKKRNKQHKKKDYLQHETRRVNHLDTHHLINTDKYNIKHYSEHKTKSDITHSTTLHDARGYNLHEKKQDGWSNNGPHRYNNAKSNTDNNAERKRLSRTKRGFLPNEEIPNNGVDTLDDLANVVDFEQLIYTTGYYSFGIYTVNPPTYTETKPVLVRFSETDWYIYVVTVDMDPKRPFLTDKEINSFKLYKDESFVSLIGEFAAGALTGTPNISNPQLDINPIRYYRALPDDVEGNTIQFRAFINVFNSRSYSTDFEQTLIPFIKDHWQSRLSSAGFLRDTVEVKSTVACPLLKQTVNGSVITFPYTPAGEIGYTWERCIGGEGAFASRKCLGGYDNGVRWGDLSYNPRCEEFPDLPQSNSSTDLKRLSEVGLNETNINDVLESTIDLTSPAINLTEADIIYTAEILYNFWKFDGILEPNVVDNIYDVANNVLERYPSIVDAAQKVTNAANRIIESVEEITSNADLFNRKTLRVVKNFLATEIWDQDGDGTLIIGLQLHPEGETRSTSINATDIRTVEQPDETDITDTAIYLDEELLTGEKTRTAFQIYSKTTLFTVVNSNRFELVSKVAAARLDINGIRVTELGTNNVTIIFTPLKDDERTVCAFWDYAANEDAGGWVTDGCTTKLMSDRRIVCVCNHLTNFAVLVDLEADTISDTNKLILEIVTKIGLIVSIIGLSLTILTFLVFKHLRNGRGQQVLINLAVAMLCSALIFLIGMDRTENKAGCKVVAALLHYFIMVSFMWMLVEGILQYLRFVKVLGTYIPKFMIKTMIPAWGIPIIPVVVIAAIDHDLYYGGKGYCWLERDAMLYGFIIPVAVILFANIIVFCMVLCSLFRRRSSGMKSNQSERKMAFLHFQAALSIFVILGLTWIFGFLAIDGARVIFHYVFAILNAFQGFFIFLLFTAREKQIRKAWKKLCCKDSTGKTTSSSTGTDVAKRKTSDANTNSTAANSSFGKSGNGYHRNKQNPAEFQNIGYEA